MSGTATADTQTPGPENQTCAIPEPGNTPSDTQNYMLSIDVSGCGMAIGTGIYASGEKIPVVALPGSDNWYFDGWIGDIGMVEDPQAASSRVLLSEDCYIAATFKQKLQPGIKPEMTAAIAGAAVILLLSGFFIGRFLSKDKNRLE